MSDDQKKDNQEDEQEDKDPKDSKPVTTESEPPPLGGQEPGDVQGPGK